MHSYCGYLLYKVNPATRNNLSDHLICNIADHLGIDYRHMPGHETFYRLYAKGKCGHAMREKLAIYHYAKAEEHKRPELQKAYMHIARNQRLRHTPYWDRFVKEHAHLPAPEPAKAVLLTEPFEECLLKCDTELVEKILQATKKVAAKKNKQKRKKRGKK